MKNYSKRSAASLKIKRMKILNLNLKKVDHSLKEIQRKSENKT